MGASANSVLGSTRIGCFSAWIFGNDFSHHQFAATALLDARWFGVGYA